MQAEHTFPKQPKAITQNMRDKEEKHTGQQLQPNAILLNVCKLLNQSLSPYRYLNVIMSVKKLSKRNDNKVEKTTTTKKIMSLFQITLSRPLCLATTGKNVN